MSRSSIGLFVGLVLGIVVVFGGFLELLAVIVFGAVGLVVGRFLDGKLDVQELLGNRSNRR
ncbi:putative membrane protein [Arthrobacter sp. CAN_A212]|uniref:DUF2273 domain-containing protein n=1 Tax=Arthrobacter sp. CAN_A212 TaxID=2787719 RepID=UPI0018C8D91E